MKRIVRMVWLICFGLFLSGCATMTIEGDVPKTAISKKGTETRHGSYYDFVWVEPIVTKCENRRGLARARYHTNVTYALVSIVSLGLYVPQTVEWWCDGTAENSVDEEVYHPPGQSGQ